MAQTQHIMRIDLDPAHPVPEICSVIKEVTLCHPGKEFEILQSVAITIEKRLNQLKGDAKRDAKPIRESDTKQVD